jgi:3-dehydroquinate synthase
MDAELFGYLEEHVDAILARDSAAVSHIVARCCRLKADIVEKDEREETGLRALLNYGHTFAHAFETAAGYGGWLHGEAVAVGMICASRLAERLGLVSAEATARQLQLLQRFSLPCAPRPWPVADLIATMRHDKKTQAGRLRFILPSRLGAAGVVDDIADNDVELVLRDSIR